MEGNELGGVGMGEKKGLDKSNIAVIMILGGFVGMFLPLFLFNLIGEKGSVLFIIAILFIVVGFIMIMLEKLQDKESHIANINTFQEEYDEYADRLGIVKSDTQVTLINLDETCNTHLHMQHYLWIDNGMLNIFPMAQYYIHWHTSSESKPDVSELKLKSVPINSILYFEEIGELRKYTTVSGGGTSLKGALLGYAVAEDIGAIIGSREPIKTSVVSEDDRSVELIYKNKDGNIENLEFTHDAYKVFKNLIPEKELRRIVNLKASKKEGKVSKNKVQQPQTAKDKLKQLKEMMNEGLLTEDEFLEQKRKILDSF